MNALSILTVPAFDDNYLWIVHDGTHALLIDPGDASAIMTALSTHNLTPLAILLTHHHHDHIGGVAELLTRFDMPLYGPVRTEMPAATRAVLEGQTLRFAPLDLTLQVWEVPGHTRDHVAYYAQAQGWMFSGDTLFGAGCGRLYDGTAPQLWQSLERLAGLPDATQIFCAHEYTLSNLRFALTVEPDNAVLKQRYADESTKRDAGMPTVPLSLGIEKRSNPFLRVAEERVLNAMVDAGKLSAEPKCLENTCRFAALRRWKDSFR